MPAASGVVLELGPGLGNQLGRFDKAKVTRIIGVENNANFAPDIQQQIRKQGLEGIYELITCGVEDGDTLEKHGIEPGSVDTVISIQVMCSVPNPDAVAKELYRALKPGGKFIFWEHHRNSDWLTAAVQCKSSTAHPLRIRRLSPLEVTASLTWDGMLIVDFWNPAWRLLIGGCNMTRSITAILLAAGEWEDSNVIQGDEKPWSMLPRVWGVLVKPTLADD